VSSSLCHFRIAGSASVVSPGTLAHDGWKELYWGFFLKSWLGLRGDLSKGVEGKISPAELPKIFDGLKPRWGMRL
jgi:hypothetical protein